MSFVKGVIPWNKGKTSVYSKETLDQWSLARKGRIGYFKDRKHSPEAILKMREAHKNQLNRKGPKGKPWSSARVEAQAKRQGAPYKSSLRRKPVVKKGKEYSPDWHKIRKAIYERDKWVCQECGVHCHHDNKIQCHHIDYDISHNDFSNLITLCAVCHGKSNFSREDWTEHYKNIIGVQELMALEKNKWLMYTE